RIWHAFESDGSRNEGCYRQGVCCRSRASLSLETFDTAVFVERIPIDVPLGVFVGRQNDFGSRLRGRTRELVFEVLRFPGVFLCRLVILGAKPRDELDAKSIERTSIGRCNERNAIRRVVCGVRNQILIQVTSIDGPARKRGVLLPAAAMRVQVVARS